MKWLETQANQNVKHVSTATNLSVTQTPQLNAKDNIKDGEMGKPKSDPVNIDSINEARTGSTIENVAQPALKLPSVPLFDQVQTNLSVTNDLNSTAVLPTMANVDNKKDDLETSTNNDVLSRDEDVLNFSEDGPSFLDYGDDDINAEEANY